MTVPTDLSHHLTRMTGRDPHEQGRVASSLELLFDLTFVVCFAEAGSQFAHLAAGGSVGLALFGYGLALFATIWAWINFAWFASAYDTDDWFYRVVTMVQMVGAVILALGIRPFFESLHEGHGQHIDNTMMVLGYVVMRVAMVIQWSRAYLQVPGCRPVARTYVITLVVAQLGWVALAIAHTSLTTFAIVGLVLAVIEMAGPFFAETRNSTGAGTVGGTPWHPHHIAERYSLLVIVTLGEGIVGTVAALSAAVGAAGEGWTLEAWLVVFAGIGLTFGIWWMYFSVAWADGLHANPQRGFGFGYGHILVFAAVAAIGAGLHICGYEIAGESELSAKASVLSVVIPIALFCIALFTIYAALFRTMDTFHVLLLVGMAVCLLGAVGAVVAGLSMGWSLLIATLAPLVTIIGFETVGHQHQASALEKVEQQHG